MKIVPGGFLMPPRFVHEPGEPAYDAAQELARVLPDHPDWSQPYDGDTTAQKETGPRQYGFRTGPWAGVSWDCGAGGRWSAFVRGDSVSRSDLDASAGDFRTAAEAVAAADAALAVMLGRMPS